MYYIISLKHTHRNDKFVTLWRPDNAGYCWGKQDAGTYVEIIEGYHNGEGDSILIKCDEANDLFIKSKVDSIGTIKLCIPNCKPVWELLEVKMTKNGLVKIKGGGE